MDHMYALSICSVE